MTVTASTREIGETTSCDACPLRASAGFRDFTDHELDFVRRFKVGETQVAPGGTILLEGKQQSQIFTVLAGWGFRYKLMEDGRRQILNFVLPGDLIGLQGSVLDELHHSVEALTTMKLCIFRRERLWSLYRDHPGLALDVTWMAARQEFILDENLASIGRRSARERVAYFLMQLYRRAEQAGLAQDHEVTLPFTQQHFADALGLSVVHTNKTLKQLSSRGIARWRNGRLKVLDIAALASAGMCESSGGSRPRPFI